MRAVTGADATRVPADDLPCAGPAPVLRRSRAPVDMLP